MTDLTLATLGWSPFFQSQLDLDEIGAFTPARIASVHRDRVTVLTEGGAQDLTLDPTALTTGRTAVGDWLLADLPRHRVERLLDRETELARGTEYHSGERQLIAANLDTLFITTSCNADFNEARLERYLALAHDSGIQPLILLTKADMADDPEAYVLRAQALGRGLEVLALDATQAEGVVMALARWCGPGETVALAGTSGVGKTTVANALTGGDAATQGIREDDARGRHTTTGRAMHRIPTGGWLIDTPGMRSLGMAEAAQGIDATFPEISELAEHCRFRDCAHESEPGCAVTAAVVRGEIGPDRLARYKKLQRENTQATETIAQARERSRKFGKMVKGAMKQKTRDR